MKPSFWIALGALLAGLSVAAGAVGAHGLKTRLQSDTGMSPSEVAWRLEVFEKAVRYQMYHAIALVLLGLIVARKATPCLTIAGASFVVGIALFSGCLYAVALGGPRKLVHVVPFGGVSYLVGWISLAVAAWRVGHDG
ncbi:MAG TPA: DUF423 domain-containing protein [Pirellulales bacterium]|nr:DUF423 domain-containing protein [Pirellulales bacterium]